ncbi:MAG: UDP-3-O-(3-hydroxymyristoyl)glucosamine N-acyltransferase, partial [Duncaniella sp.]|nr:UDP-3-O-(3-hydroxymyristoyl)glucosamine N-acyltransferase [Duncaniella sp.]
VDDPYATLPKLLEMVSQMTKLIKTGIEQPSFIAPGVEIPADAYVGAFAYIGEGAVIGAGAKIYPQTYVGANCRVGEGTILYPGVKVYDGCEIGARCIIHSGAVVGSDGFGFAPVGEKYEKIPQTGNVVIADDVEIGANTTIDRAMMGSTHIGQGVKLDNLIQVAHNCAIGDNTVMAAQVGVAGSAKIGKHCMVGGQVGFVGHISIADDTVIGAQSGVTRETKPGDRIIGSPAVDMGEFARSLVYVKRIPRIMEQIRDIEKRIKK